MVFSLLAFTKSATTHFALPFGSSSLNHLMKATQTVQHVYKHEMENYKVAIGTASSKQIDWPNHDISIQFRKLKNQR
ncbi:hypothetical protein GBA52_020242, partial [Prunus armeniaca]